MFVNCSQNGQLGLYQNQCTFQKIHSLSTGGAHSRLLVHIASSTSPPYVGTQLTALFHTQPLLKCLVYGNAAQTVNCVFWLKPSLHPKHLITVTNYRLGIRPRDLAWVYVMNTLSATVAFLMLLPDTNLLPQAGITHYSQLLTRQHSFKLLVFFFSSIVTAPKWKENGDWSAGDKCIPSAKYWV